MELRRLPVAHTLVYSLARKPGGSPECMTTIISVLIILEVLLLFNLLIGVHELGHFLAAKWRGLKIDRFAIWFGKPIWKKKINGVEYVLGCIPFGGYVALPQMATMEAIEGKSTAETEPLPPVSALDKIIVAFAGPLFSFLLAFAFAVIVWGVGRPGMEPSDDSTLIGWAQPDGPAWKAGLRPGDRILEVDGHAVTQFSPLSGGRSRSLQDSVTWQIITSEGTNIAIKYERTGKECMAYPIPYRRPTKWYERKALRQILIGSAYPATIAEVISNSPAARAGLRVGDEIMAVDGEKIFSAAAVVQKQNEATNPPARPVTFTVKRGDERFDRVLLAEKPLKPATANPSFGMFLWGGSTNEILTYPPPFDQISESAGQIFATLNTVLSRKSDVGVQQLGGAVMIIRAYKNLFGSDNGWRRVLWFSVVLNVNLALLNLLPLPVLDGGHILLSLIEIIRRRPVSARFLGFLQNGFAALLITFMIYIAFFDFGDWVRSARKERLENQPVVFAPKP
jgi:regulator of sigma E protease